MNARQGVLHSSLYGEDIDKLFPVITPGGSDSGRSTTQSNSSISRAARCPT